MSKRFATSCAVLAAIAIGTSAFGQRPSPGVGPNPVYKSASWPMKGGDPGRRNRTWAPGPDQGVVAWRVQTGGSIPNIAVNGFGQAILGVYFIDESWSGESYFGALSSAGEWDARIRVKPYDWGASQGVNSAPALSQDNTLFFNSGFGQLLRYSPTLDLQQTIQRNSNITNDSAPAVSPDGTLYHYQSITGLAKYNRKGGLMWNASVSSQSDVAVAPNGDCAMGGVRTNEPHGSSDLTYINANGTRRWILTSSNGSRYQAMFGPDGSLYYGGAKYNTANGAVVWSAGITADPMSYGWRNEIYFSSFNSIRAISPTTGATLWSTVIPNETIINRNLAVDGRGFLYATTRSGRLVKIDTVNGAIVYDRQVAGSILTGPVIGTDRSIYFTTLEGYTTFVVKVF